MKIKNIIIISLLGIAQHAIASERTITYQIPGTTKETTAPTLEIPNDLWKKYFTNRNNIQYQAEFMAWLEENSPSNKIIMKPDKSAFLPIVVASRSDFFKKLLKKNINVIYDFERTLKTMFERFNLDKKIDKIKLIQLLFVAIQQGIPADQLHKIYNDIFAKEPDVDFKNFLKEKDGFFRQAALLADKIYLTYLELEKKKAQSKSAPSSKEVTGPKGASAGQAESQSHLPPTINPPYGPSHAVSTAPTAQEPLAGPRAATPPLKMLSGKDKPAQSTPSTVSYTIPGTTTITTAQTLEVPTDLWQQYDKNHNNKQYQTEFINWLKRNSPSNKIIIIPDESANIKKAFLPVVARSKSDFFEKLLNRDINVTYEFEETLIAILRKIFEKSDTATSNLLKLIYHALKQGVPLNEFTNIYDTMIGKETESEFKQFLYKTRESFIKIIQIPNKIYEEEKKERAALIAQSKSAPTTTPASGQPHAVTTAPSAHEPPAGPKASMAMPASKTAPQKIIIPLHLMRDFWKTSIGTPARAAQQKRILNWIDVNNPKDKIIMIPADFDYMRGTLLGAVATSQSDLFEELLKRNINVTSDFKETLKALLHQFYRDKNIDKRKLIQLLFLAIQQGIPAGQFHNIYNDIIANEPEDGFKKFLIEKDDSFRQDAWFTYKAYLEVQKNPALIAESSSAPSTKEVTAKPATAGQPESLAHLPPTTTPAYGQPHAVTTAPSAQKSLAGPRAASTAAAAIPVSAWPHFNKLLSQMLPAKIVVAIGNKENTVVMDWLQKNAAINKKMAALANAIMYKNYDLAQELLNQNTPINFIFLLRQFSVSRPVALSENVNSDTSIISLMVVDGDIDQRFFENVVQLADTVHLEWALKRTQKVLTDLGKDYTPEERATIQSKIDILKQELENAQEMADVRFVLKTFTPMPIDIIKTFELSDRRIQDVKKVIEDFKDGDKDKLKNALGENNKNLSLADANGFTPLLFAVYLNNFDAVKFILPLIISLIENIDQQIKQRTEDMNTLTKEKDAQAALLPDKKMAVNNLKKTNSDPNLIARHQKEVDEITKKRDDFEKDIKIIEKDIQKLQKDQVTHKAILIAKTKDGYNAYCLAEFLQKRLRSAANRPKDEAELLTYPAAIGIAQKIIDLLKPRFTGNDAKCPRYVEGRDFAPQPAATAPATTAAKPAER